MIPFIIRFPVVQAWLEHCIIYYTWPGWIGFESHPSIKAESCPGFITFYEVGGTMNTHKEVHWNATIAILEQLHVLLHCMPVDGQHYHRKTRLTKVYSR